MVQKLGSLAVVATVVGLTCGVANASTIASAGPVYLYQGTGNVGSVGPENLTAQGVIDWAYYPGEYDHKGLAGINTPAVGDISNISGGGGYFTDNDVKYVWSDGSIGSPTQSSTGSTRGTYSTLNPLTASVILPIAGTTYDVRVYVGFFESQPATHPTLSATLGSASYSNSSIAMTNSSAARAYYDLIATPDTGGQLLNISFSFPAGDVIAIDAITLSPVPEPSSVCLICLGALGLLLVRWFSRPQSTQT